MRKPTPLLPSLALLLALTGCGSERAAPLADAGGSGTVDWDPNGGSGGGSQEPRTGVAPFEYKVSGTSGSSDWSKKVSMRRILKVRFIPGIQTKNSVQYSSMGVFIQIGANSKPTPLLFNGYAGTPSEQSAPIDLTDLFTRKCGESSSSTCRQEVIIRVNRPQSDSICWWRTGFGCPGYYEAHLDDVPWNGTLVVETDNTDPIPQR